MAPLVKKEVLQSVAQLGPSVDDDFYVATFRGGKVRKVINMMCGPPRRVRRVLDFDSKVEIEKEEALARKRKELGSGSEFEVLTGKKEKTLAEFLLEMKKRKNGGAVATVQRKKLIPSKKVNSVKKAVPVRNVIPVKEVVSINDTVSTEEVVLLDEGIHREKVVPMEEAIPVEDSPPRKKRKRRSTSLLHTRSKLLDPPSEPLDPPSEPLEDDETLAEYMKKSVSTTGRASSDNAGIKVFQRRKVKFKAVRRRADEIGDKQSSSILVCDDLCECEVCGALSPVAPKTVEYPTTGSRVSGAVSVLTSFSTSSVSNNFPEDGNLEGPSTNWTEQLSHPDFCMGEFDTLTLPDDLHQLPALLRNPPMDDTEDIHELTEEQFRVEVVQQVPSNSEVTALGSDSSCSALPVSQCPENSHVGKYDEYFGASNDGPELCDSDMPEVIDATSRPQLLSEETSGIEGDDGQGPCAFNTESSNFSFASPLNRDGNTHPLPENTASAVTPMELDLAVERIESILETLVTPDDLLPTHLSASKSIASKSTRKKKKRRRFSESVSHDLVTTEGSYLGVVSLDNLRIPQRQVEDSAVPPPLEALTPVMENVLRSVSDISEEVALFATSESSDILAQQDSGQISKQISEQVSEQVSDQISEQVSEQISGQISGHISEQISEQISGQISGQILEQISELLLQELGLALEPTSSLLSEAKDAPVASPRDVEVVLPKRQEDTVVNAEECTSNGINSLVPLSDAVEVVGTPTKSISYNEGSGICQTASTGLDAAERDEGVGGTSTSKALFSNLKTDGFSKRNRKSFSPKSQKAFLEACRPDRSTPPFKIKLMKSKLSDRCPSMLFPQEMVKEKPYSEKQYPTPDDSSPQDMLRSDVGQIQLVATSDSRPLSRPPQTSDDTPSMSSPSRFGTLSECNTHVVPGSPEYKKEPYVSRQNVADSVSICAPDNSVSTLTCTEGSLHINVECRPETPSDAKTTNKNIEPSSQQPKSILKTRSDTCRGVCECPRCVSKCNESKTARKFIISQMRLADLVASRLLDEMRNMRRLVEDASPSCAEGEAAISAINIPFEKAKVALESVTKTEDWAQKEILKMSRDSKRVCRLIEEGPRKTIFADDAGHRLCQVRFLPAKKTLSNESLLPTKNL